MLVTCWPTVGREVTTNRKWEPLFSIPSSQCFQTLLGALIRRSIFTKPDSHLFFLSPTFVETNLCFHTVKITFIHSRLKHTCLVTNMGSLYLLLHQYKLFHSVYTSHRDSSWIWIPFYYKEYLETWDKRGLEAYKISITCYESQIRRSHTRILTLLFHLYLPVSWDLFLLHLSNSYTDLFFYIPSHLKRPLTTTKRR